MTKLLLWKQKVKEFYGSEDAFTDVDDNGVRGVHSEEYLLYVGFSQPDEKSEALGAGRGIWIRRR